MIERAQEPALGGPEGLDILDYVLQFLLGECHTALQQGLAQFVRQLIGGGVVQIQLAVGGAKGGAQGIFNNLAVGVQLFFVVDLSADQNFRLPGNLLHRNFARNLALERRADLLHRRLLIETQVDERSAFKVDTVVRPAMHRQTRPVRRPSEPGSQ